MDAVIDFSSDTLWIVVVGFIVAFFLAFGVGANDVANSFGTSVGAKVLTMKQACILATIFETLGAILIGYKVSDTVRKGIFDITIYEEDGKMLMLGNLAALFGSASWNIIATFFSLPISGTHSIVGAVVGFSLVAKGTNGINWLGLGQIVLSWFISPVFSGVFSALLFAGIRKFILHHDKPLEQGLVSLPMFYALTIFINVFSVVHDGPQVLYFHLIPLWGVIFISVFISVTAALAVWFILVPRLRGKIVANVLHPVIGDKCNGSLTKESICFDTMISVDPLNDTIHSTCSSVVTTPIKNYGNKPPLPLTTAVNSNPNPEGNIDSRTRRKRCRTGCDRCKRRSIASLEVAILEESQREDTPEVAELFSFLQILTAIFGSFAHGGNDVSNAIGPLIALWMIFTDGSVAQKSETPIWILLYGGMGISIGLWVWGRKVIQTIGEDLTKVTPSNGFSIEVGAATTVLLASKAGIPISTTHCKVGSIVFVGWLKSTTSVDWRLFRGIVAAWLFTLPIAGGMSAGIMALLMRFAL